MRVDLFTLREFLDEALDQHAQAKLLDNTVRVQTHSVAEQKEAISFEVYLCLTAIVTSDRGSYLIEHVSSCGRDIKKQQDESGTTSALSAEAHVRVTLESVGIKVRAGRINVGLVD